MGIAITDEHRELSSVARSFLESADVLKIARAALDAPTDEVPPFWSEMAALGWLGLHLPEELGGSGFALPELVIVLEELGRVVAPGPFLASSWAAGVLAHSGPMSLQSAFVPGLADGTLVGAVGTLTKTGARPGISGNAYVLGGGLADVLLLIAGDDVVVLDRHESGVTVTPMETLDPTRRVVQVRLSNVDVDPARVLGNAAPFAVALGRTLGAAEAAGGARACVEMAADYAKVRHQFGRVIGTFQAVKHHAANMTVATELATAAAWDAARAASLADQFDLAAAVAAVQSLDAFVACAQMNIQLHGGIGYTWEHDAHLFLRRAATLAACFGPIHEARRDVSRLRVAGTHRRFGVDLPPEAESIRDEVRSFVASLQKMEEPSDQLRAMLDAGYVLPHWPKPWGRAAGAVEQLVIDEEFRDIARPYYGIGGWILQTLTQHGTEDQIERWIRPSLEGQLQWCQLFSEPDAGSDAAGIRTRATRVAGGWVITGQKIWTTGAQHSHRGLATVRTDPDAPKHKGITVMVVDLTDPNVEVRPLREASGRAMFCEVFFNDVFVPDEDVVGAVNAGWNVARSTLGNERVSIGTGPPGSGMGLDVLALAKAHRDDVAAQTEIGKLLAEEQAITLLNLRTTERAVVGAEAGAEGGVAKLLNGEHAQRVVELALALGDARAALLDDAEAGPGRAGVAAAEINTRFLTIAGGTSEIVRNQIGERILGLPRDPLVN